MRCERWCAIFTVQGLLNESVRGMLEGAFNISRMRASDIMIPALGDESDPDQCLAH